MPSELSEWLKAELAKRGWSTRQLALPAGMDPRSVANIVRSGAVPRMETILKMAQALEEDPQVMLRLAGHMPTFVPETTDEDNLLLIFRALPHHLCQAMMWMVRGMHIEYQRGVVPGKLGEGQRVRVVLEGTVEKEYDEPDHYLIRLDEPPDVFHRDQLLEVAVPVARRSTGGA